LVWVWQTGNGVGMGCERLQTERSQAATYTAGEQACSPTGIIILNYKPISTVKLTKKGLKVEKSTSEEGG